MERLSIQDASFLYLENEYNHMSIAALAIFEGPGPAAEPLGSFPGVGPGAVVARVGLGAGRDRRAALHGAGNRFSARRGVRDRHDVRDRLGDVGDQQQPFAMHVANRGPADGVNLEPPGLGNQRRVLRRGD